MSEKKASKKTWAGKPAKKLEPDRRIPKKVDISGAAKSNYELTRWILIIVMSLLFAVLLYPGLLSKPKQYKLGDIAERDIKATHEFLIEDTALTEKNRLKAVREAPPVYDFDPSGSNALGRLRDAFEEGRRSLRSAPGEEAASHGPSATTEAGRTSPALPSFSKERFSEILGLQVQEEVFEVLKKTGFPAEVENLVIRLLSPILHKGVVRNKRELPSQMPRGIILHNILTDIEITVTETERILDLDQAKRLIVEEWKKTSQPVLPPDLKKVGLVLALSLLEPNVTFNKRETELRKEAARKAVKPVYFKVRKGEMIVREGEPIRQEHLLKLAEEYRYLRKDKFLGHIPAMAILIGFLLFSFYLVTGPTRSQVPSKKRDLIFQALILTIFFLLAISANFIAAEVARGFPFLTPRALIFAIPIATGPMLVSLFQGMRVAAGFSVLLSVLTALVLGGKVEFFVYFLVGGLIAAHGMKECRERGEFIKTGLKVGLANMVLALSIETLHGFFYTVEPLVACVTAFLGGILVAVITTGSVPLVEMAFGYTTDIKLLELASLDQPLLRELMVQAPGTYHHSVIVSQMVEASAKAVGANPLLAKVAAYYHDIGKMKKPLYFIENQVNGQNKHEKLAPSMSSLILISHVKDGVELAKKYKLGQPIIDIIQQHHGTSLITYFYEKAKEQAGQRSDKAVQVKEEDFRYPGPKPQTKEAGLVMLADAVQAASKTLVDPTPARIQGLVQKIINRIFSDGQLDECELTLKDLHLIAKSFNKTLSGIFHQRIEYPEPVIRAPGGKRAANGNIDQPPAGDSRSQRTEDKKKNGESLRRLGLS
ncbi:MAG: HD family phosphohydrolase [Deltaproteobacteria bacterium]|nr:MAG: HD family phosphohydrolase [Deltaproteobacteria bacterium]